MEFRCRAGDKDRIQRSTLCFRCLLRNSCSAEQVRRQLPITVVLVHGESSWGGASQPNELGVECK